MNYKIRQIYRIEGGILDGTEIEPFMFTVLVRYTHRKTADCYIPPTSEKGINGKVVKTWHCCQDNCPNPDFEGKIDKLVEHLVFHKGRLLKKWNKKAQLKSPIPAIRLPKNDWVGNVCENDTNKDRRFCVQLYIDKAERMLRQQRLEVLK